MKRISFDRAYRLTSEPVVGLDLILSKANEVDNTTQYGASSLIRGLGNIA
jgi:hypothetical protein